MIKAKSTASYVAEIARLKEDRRINALRLAIASYERLGGNTVATKEIVDRAEVFVSYLATTMPKKPEQPD